MNYPLNLTTHWTAGIISKTIFISDYEVKATGTGAAEPPELRQPDFRLQSLTASPYKYQSFVLVE